MKARTEVTRRITHLGRQGKPKQAISELTQLAKMGIQPDTQAATALVSACTANRNMDMAMNVFEELFGALQLLCTPSHGKGTMSTSMLQTWMVSMVSPSAVYESTRRMHRSLF